MMPTCKKCSSARSVKNGIVAGKQRYRCKECGHSFREGDNRTDSGVAAKKAMCYLLYATGKASFRNLGRIFRTSHSLIYRWIRAFGEGLPEPEVDGEIKEMEFDEMWHFVGQKKTSFGSSKPLTVAHVEPWPGCSAIVILRQSGGSTTK
jgi:transposase